MSHYSIHQIKGDALETLQGIFPDAKADEMNFCLFSTSGVHGTYTTIEEGLVEDFEVTVLVVHPRLVCLKYGTVRVTAENVAYLKALRASSWAVVPSIGAPGTVGMAP